MGITFSYYLRILSSPEYMITVISYEKTELHLLVTAENKRQIQSSVDAQNLQPKHIPFSSQIDAYPGVSVFHLLIIFSNRTRMFPTPPCHVEILLFSTVTIPISYPTVHIVVQLVPHVLYSNIPIQSHVLFTFLLRSLRV